jgi:hypothetical protein
MAYAPAPWITVCASAGATIAVDRIVTTPRNANLIICVSMEFGLRLSASDRQTLIRVWIFPNIRTWRLL